ncbi:DUF6364 family protein [Zunongwangia sp. F363]|uniref:DUF6364 family protein n=1 Tax=Autumnicola tepida TaxID=3075595 RepID=A0ABU3C846_9FLAO|nr:DUF6364 family protein [Zunongwangia sp. F363]MDT0642482.1 DUF6364 family protein [Zunongwangia sp. F363]
MDTKLTLSLNKAVIEKAKKYVSAHNTSLSRMVECYLAAVIESDEKNLNITPLVESLSGVINVDADFDYKKEYGEYLTHKYK